MRLLITNDDGIGAPGLRALVRGLRGLGEVIVVAPDREQSGVGASFSIHHPVRLRRLRTRGVRTYAVDGTPADAVILALDHLLRETPVDAVVAGINQGTNLGDDVLLSGTVGAALHALFRGVPAIAISMPLRKRPRYASAARVARSLVPAIAGDDLFKDVLLNVTVPNLGLEQIRGVEVTRLRPGGSTVELNAGHDGRRDYFWIGVARPKRPRRADILEGTDLWALREKRISITPLHTDMTAFGAVEALAGVTKALRAALGTGAVLDPSHGATSPS